ncbi:MAG TPA: adenylate/guanylate cyclase domain-containing protein, partial [Anaerolineales bacterium]|nr:adenylate/guanylate cyclase domain-containing protein [Anaerolineales bacterium]
MTHPSGTVNFLFTDIEGSTKLAQEHPDEMPALLARHNEILNQAIEANNGYVFQIIGDAFCAAFHSASDALNASMDAQRALQSEAWNPAPIKVRMGIHTGTAQLNDDEQYSGYATLASTQRIMSAGHGGQVLLSNITRELAGDGLPTDTEIIDLGEKRLKDLLRPERLYQLNISGPTTTFPPLKTLDSFPNNLPVHLTSFIGRESEIDEVKDKLKEHRLVTLTGSGGTGKTRLSLQVAAEVIEKFDHGIWFVELAPLTDPDLIPQTILSAIGIREQEGKTPLDLLKEYLSEKRTLIVLDNCEHLISASAQVVNELLRAAPRVKVLTSSREALGVRGEVSYPVPSLTLPNLNHLPAIEGLSQYEAVRLFIDRALLVAPHFEVDKDNAPYIAQICHRLDGIPLAIELAAARAKVLSVDQISKRLDDRFRLLTGGARTALPRQQTLRALIDWSYDLLEENERLLLCRLSVFMGDWTLEAAEEVCEGDGIDSYDVLDLLSQLVNKSLVVVNEKSKSGETRYRMLETIRQYARDKLLETGGGDAVRDKHLAYFVKLTEQAEPELYRANQVFWINKLDDELDNIRAAVKMAIATDAKSGLKILNYIPPFLGSRGLMREVEAWLTKLLSLYDNADAVRAHGLAHYGWILSTQFKLSDAHKILEQSLEISRSIPDKKSEALSLSILG